MGCKSNLGALGGESTKSVNFPVLLILSLAEQQLCCEKFFIILKKVGLGYSRGGGKV